MDADNYLTIPRVYADALGGLRWSKICDAVEFDDGRTLAVVEQLALVLEGVFSAHPEIPHFAHVLHLLKLTSRGGAVDPKGPTARLHQAFLNGAGPGISRNIGVFFAHLCRRLPHVGAPPQGAAIHLELKRRMLFPDAPDPRRSEKPPLGPDKFEQSVAEILYHYDLPTLTHWIRHGVAPADAAGRRLANSLCEPPHRVEPLTAVLRRRPRLAGAVALAPALDAALSLPPRRRRLDAIPQGGYAGVVTRGDPERLLPSQFALDPIDFVRRFAEHELLYFRREEPHRGDRPLRLVVLDQGVRTWGGVRLALAAAVIALIGKDRRRAGPLRLAVTSADRLPFDPADIAPESLADLLESSDLTSHPADRLNTALVDIADRGPRDVILLTHPRALREPAVRTAAARCSPTDRLFTLAVDDHGRAELCEWRVGGVVQLRSFRVDLAERAVDRAAAEPRMPSVALGAPRLWTGHVEPVAYPFRPGLLGEPAALAFDAAGEWVAVLGPHGLLHLAKLDGSAPEVLPRPMLGGVVLMTGDTVLGVDGGFVLCGLISRSPGQFQFDSSGSPTDVLTWPMTVAVHYDLMRRHATIHALGTAGTGQREWYSFPDLHGVAMKAAGRCRAVDLGTGSKYPPDGWERNTIERARQAYDRADALARPLPGISLLAPGQSIAQVRGPWVKCAGGVVWLGNVQPPWPPFIPKSDGRRLLDGVIVGDRAQLAGHTLAFEASTGDDPQLYLFHGPSGRYLAQFDCGRPLDFRFKLSPDGRRLARQTREAAVLVNDTANADRPVAYLGRAKRHSNLSVQLERSWVKVAVGKIVHTFTLDTALMHHSCMRSDENLAAATAHPTTPIPTAFGYDPLRFLVAAARFPWTAVVDAWGQVILLDRTGRAAAYILVRRRLAAIVLPDGTRWGAPALLGGPETPGAGLAVGKALLAAAGGEA
jgi:hypothetical protein